MTLGERLELATGATRRLDIANRQHDLHVGGQGRGAFAGLDGLGQDPADRGLRDIRLALGQPQQGQARLRLPPAPARLPVRLLGRAEIAEHPVDLSLPVTGLTGGRRVLPLQAALGCPPRLLQGVRPGALELHDLGAMHETATGEGHEVGLALAPARKRGSPLLCATDLVSVPASEDHAAVDDAGDDRGELAGGDRHHRLVQ